MDTYDLIIIGAGPAGITAGIYAGRQKMKTLLIAKEFGGQMAKKATEVCNYPGFGRISGQELIQKFVDHLKEQDCVDIKFAQAKEIKKNKNIFAVLTEKKEEFFSKSVIIASGADPRLLEAKGEKEYIGKGVSYCVTCDGPLFRNKAIAVVGGGNAGFEAAIFMTRYASKIYILEAGQKVKADRWNQEDAKGHKNIEVITGASVKEIKGSALVSSLVYEDQASKKEKTLEVQGVFIEIGSQPASSFAAGLVNFNKRDEIEAEFETLQTKTPGLFAAGDINTGPYKQIVTAAGEGCKASLAVYDYLRKTK